MTDLLEVWAWQCFAAIVFLLFDESVRAVSQGLTRVSAGHEKVLSRLRMFQLSFLYEYLITVL